VHPLIHSPMRLIALCAGLVAPIAMLNSASFAQDSAVLVVDVSPTAEQLFAQAEEQFPNNPSEAARLMSRVLDDFGRRLVHVPGTTDQFIDCRARAEAFLRAHPQVLERFRSAQSGEAQRLVADGEDRIVVETRLLTAAGMMAAIRQAQAAVEAAEFQRAADLLESISGHPDIASLDRAIHATLIALSAWGRSDDGTVNETVQALATADDENLRRLAERLAVITASRVAESVVVNPLSPSPFGAIATEPVRLWSEPLEGSIYSRLRESIQVGAIGEGGFEEGGRTGRFLASIPTVDGSLVIVNEGYIVRAYDAYSHLPRWYQFIGDRTTQRVDTQAGDMEVVAIASDCVLTLSGHAGHPGSTLGIERSGGGRLVCLDMLTGQRRWEVAPQRLADPAIFFYGTPTVVHNTVVILGRKVTSRLETVSLAMGVNLHTGVIEWTTPIGVAPGVRSESSRPFTNAAVDRGQVFISTGSGAIACVDAIDGRVRWIHRYPVPIRDFQMATVPWEMGGAVVTTRGVLTINPNGTSLLLLRADNGDEIESVPVGPGTKLGSIRYLLTDRDHAVVYGIGDEIVAFRAEKLDNPIWKFIDDPTDGLGLSFPIRPMIRGRVQSGWLESGRPALVVPLASRAVVLDADDGKIIRILPCQGPANIVVRDGVIASVTNDALAVLMDAARAKSILIAAVSERPTDVDAVTGLIELALRIGDADLLQTATTTVNAAIEGVRNNVDRRTRFMEILIKAAQSGLLGRTGSDDLFASIVRASTSPIERANALVAQGDWLEKTGRSAGAIAAWRGVLVDGDASQVPIFDWENNNPQLKHSASRVVLRKLERLAIAPASAAQSAQVAETAPSGGSASDLEHFAERNPCTVVAARAWIQAARIRIAEASVAIAAGDAAAAVDTAIASGNRAAVAEILDHAVTLLNQSQRTITAAQMLDRAVVAGFDVALVSFGGAVASQVLLASPAAQVVVSLPRPLAATETVTAQSDNTVRRIVATLAPVRMSDVVSSLNSQTYLLNDHQLTCLASPDLSQRWTRPILGDKQRVYPISDGVIVIDQRTRTALAAQWIDDGGEVRWRIDDLAAQLTKNGDVSDQTECFVFTAHDNLIVTRVDGVAAAFSLADGRLRWQSSSTIDEVSSMHASETLIAIAGTRNRSDVRSAWIVALDQSTGKIVAELPSIDDDSLRWVTVIGPGEIGFGTSQGVGRWQVFGPATGLQWFAFSPRLRGSNDGMLLATQLAIVTTPGNSTLLDWRSGSAQQSRFGFTGGPRNSDSSRQWLRSGGVIIGWSSDSVEFFSLTGEAIGSSSLHGPRQIEWVLPASGGLIAIEQIDPSNEPREFGAPRGQSRILIHRFGWNDGGRIMGPPLEVEFNQVRIESAQAIDGWILLSGPQSTMAIALP